MYALEIQDMIERATRRVGRRPGGLRHLEERASEMVEVTARRYLSQILNFALRAARKYNSRRRCCR